MKNFTAGLLTFIGATTLVTGSLVLTFMICMGMIEGTLYLWGLVKIMYVIAKSKWLFYTAAGAILFTIGRIVDEVAKLLKDQEEPNA